MSVSRSRRPPPDIESDLGPVIGDIRHRETHPFLRAPAKRRKVDVQGVFEIVAICAAAGLVVGLVLWAIFRAFPNYSRAEPAQHSISINAR